MEAPREARRAPRWLYDARTVENLLVTRRTGKTALERTTRGVARRMNPRMNTSSLQNEIAAIRAVADGRGAVDVEAERTSAALFLEMWDAMAPSQAEVNAEVQRRKAEADRLTPAQAASAVERMARLKRTFIPAGGAA